MQSLRLGFLASHGGSNMQAIVDSIAAGRLKAEVAVVISNNSRSRATERARKESIPFFHISGKTHPGAGAEDKAILEALHGHRVNLVVLAGYMKRLGPLTLAAYDRRVVNIHPALLPKHGGQGMYGIRVHQSVLAAGDKTTGVTVHLVDPQYDHGPILAQRVVPVEEGDDAERLAARVLKVEHRFFSDTLQKIATGEIGLDEYSY